MYVSTFHFLRYDNPPWTPELVHGKDFAAILHLLVAVALHFRAPIRFPDHCKVQLVVVQRKEGQNRSRFLQTLEQYVGATAL